MRSFTIQQHTFIYSIRKLWREFKTVNYRTKCKHGAIITLVEKLNITNLFTPFEHNTSLALSTKPPC